MCFLKSNGRICFVFRLLIPLLFSFSRLPRGRYYRNQGLVFWVRSRHRQTRASNRACRSGKLRLRQLHHLGQERRLRAPSTSVCWVRYLSPLPLPGIVRVYQASHAATPSLCQRRCNANEPCALAYVARQLRGEKVPPLAN